MSRYMRDIDAYICYYELIAMGYVFRVARLCAILMCCACDISCSIVDNLSEESFNALTVCRRDAPELERLLHSAESHLNQAVSCFYMTIVLYNIACTFFVDHNCIIKQLRAADIIILDDHRIDPGVICLRSCSNIFALVKNCHNDVNENKLLRIAVEVNYFEILLNSLKRVLKMSAFRQISSESRVWCHRYISLLINCMKLFRNLYPDQSAIRLLFGNGYSDNNLHYILEEIYKFNRYTGVYFCTITQEIENKYMFYGLFEYEKDSDYKYTIVVLLYSLEHLPRCNFQYCRTKFSLSDILYALKNIDNIEKLNALYKRVLGYTVY